MLKFGGALTIVLQAIGYCTSYGPMWLYKELSARGISSPIFEYSKVFSSVLNGTLDRNKIESYIKYKLRISFIVSTFGPSKFGQYLVHFTSLVL